MSLAAFLVIAFGAAGAAIATRARERLAAGIGLVGLALLLVAAILLDPQVQIDVDGATLAVTEYVRLFLILGSLAGLGLATIGRMGGGRRDAPAATLAVLGATALTLSLVDARAAVLAGTMAGLFGVVLTLLPRARATATVGILETRAVVVAGTLAIAATAWFGRDLSQLAAQPVVFGLAYLAFGLATAIRFGAVPFHLWAARLADAVPETALPTLTALGPAAFAVVALAWTDAAVAPLLVDLELPRLVIVAIAVVTIVLAGIAAVFQDDLEHVVGYSIVGDAGIVVLAIATLDPDAWAPARIWIIVFVMVKVAFAAWAAAIRTEFWTGRLDDLRGWALHAPILLVALALTVAANLGIPGVLAYDARTTLVHLTLAAPFAGLLSIAVLAPALAYARLLLLGFRRPVHGAEVPAGWRPSLTRPRAGERRAWPERTWAANRVFAASIVAVLLATVALATATGAFDLAGAAAGLPAGSDTQSEVVGP